MSKIRLRLALAFVCLPAFAAPVEFNREVRPILSDRCFACHGPDAGNRKSQLRLDREADAKADLGKGRFGIVPGDPARSGIYQRITSTNRAMRMPPAYLGHDALPERDIATLKRWIEEGAAYQQHWSLIHPRKADLPAVRNGEWARNAIDRFVLARLEREGLTPSPEADRARLLRRVTLDLNGVPPTPAETDTFLQDTSDTAYEKVVDRLLASPRYAERMTIRWLEAARYADTNGYQSDGPRDMWRWRDWVLDAFQRNMRFDQFTIEQIAGDLLPNATLSQKIATGFHRNHRTSAEGGIVDEEFRVEYVADRTETTAQVWLGLTVGCARCHDHKYDPIPQKDYYRLFAFFNNVPEKGFVYNFGNEEPYIKAPLPEQQGKLDTFDERIRGLRQEIEKLEPALQKEQRHWEQRVGRGPAADWNVREGLTYYAKLDGGETARDGALTSVRGQVGGALRFDGKAYVDAGNSVAKFNYRDPFTFAAWIKPESPKGAILSRAEDYFEGSGHALYLIDGKIRFHEIFRWTDLGMRLETVHPVQINEWQHVAVTYDGSMKASGVRIYVNGAAQEVKVLFDQNIWPIEVKEPFRIGAGGGLRFQGLMDEVRVYDRALSADEAAVLPLLADLKDLAAKKADDRTQAERDKLRYAFLDSQASSKIRTPRLALAALEKERQAYLDAVPTVMVMAERPEIRPAFVLKRGAYDAHGEQVTAGTPSLLPALPPGSPNNRLGLARWLVSREHPLTARVTVNRYWQMLFGTGLVKTVEDFGSQGEWPLHPELLDWLAVEFMDSGWDVKHILKTMVMSATYRQSSQMTPELLQRDPENRLLARGPRLRLAPEIIRDQALAASGLLVEKVGGPSVRPYQPAGLWKELQGGQDYKADTGEGLYRRSLYTYWRRTVAPPGMVTMDSPTRETCAIRETRTNTPLQALHLMNDVTYVEAARKLAERMMRADADPAKRLEFGFRVVLVRTPKDSELAVLTRTLDRFRQLYSGQPQQAEQVLKQGDSPRDAHLPATELAAYSAVASLLLNLDEAVTKE